MLLLLHKTLKGSRNIQGFALIRVVLLDISKTFKNVSHTIVLLKYLRYRRRIPIHRIAESYIDN